MVLHAALEKPFGPYNLDDVLDGGAIPQLTSITHFKMKRDGRVTGLDETEFIPRPPDGWDAKIPITASAILEVEDLSWLTQAGKKRLQEDCTGRHPRLELESIYHGKQKVKLRVRFTMSEVPAAFMNGDKHADDELKIQWWSKNSRVHRTFIVENLHIQTYALSRNFFERYRALALLIHLKETDPETPVEDRDIKYFIRKYKEMLDDPDPESYLFRASLNEDAPANAPKPGRHRYIPDVEIKVMLGLQADWLLAQALVSAQASKGKFLDIPKWLKFCRKVRAKRRTPEGLGWGPFLQREDESEGPIEDDVRYLAKYGADEAHWQEKLRVALGPKPKPRETAKRNPPNRRLEGAPFHYDSNYEEQSSEDDDDSDCNDNYLPDDDLCSRIHPKTLAQPDIPTGNRWHCPVPQCRRVITLEQLRESASVGFHRDFKNAAWPKLKIPFLIAAKRHYMHHWYEAGVEVHVVSRYPDGNAKETELRYSGKGRPYAGRPQPPIAPLDPKIEDD